LTVSLTPAETFGGVVEVVGGGVDSEPPDEPVEPPPEEDPLEPDEEPVAVVPEEEPAPDELEDPPEPPLEFGPPEPALDGELGVELLGDEVEVEDLEPAEDDSWFTAVGSGLSSTTVAELVTSSAFAAWPWLWCWWWVTRGVGAGALVGAVLAVCVVLVLAFVGALAVCEAPPPSDLAGATAESSWPKPSAAIGHSWKTWAETRTTKRAIAIPIRVTPETAPAK
jgi:hypothetical protein